MRTSDISFTMNSGKHEGKTYHFSLAKKDGQKAWSVTRIYNPPPSNIKYKIEMGISASEGRIMANGVQDLTRIGKIIENMHIVAEETTPVTLDGLDGEKYNIIIDVNGIQEGNLTHEAERNPEFILNVLAWGLYD